MSAELRPRIDGNQEYTDLHKPPNLVLLEHARNLTAKALREQFPGNDTIVAVDFMVVNGAKCERILDDDGELLGYYYPDEKILNIDHHMDEPEMARHVSSTNLAMKLMKLIDKRQNNPYFQQNSRIVINHTDTDSILASLILSGILPPEDDRFGKAAICADHTGKENKFADLLQALEKNRDLDFSIQSLKQLLADVPLSEIALNAINTHLQDRNNAKRAVAKRLFKNKGNKVYVAHFDEKIPTEFFPSLLPYAAVIITIIPMGIDAETGEPGWEIAVRRGQTAPEGFSLKHVLCSEHSWGGRWNAGSTRRNGGYHGKLKEIIDTVVHSLDSYRSTNPVTVQTSL